MPDVSGPFDGSPWAEVEWYRHLPSAIPSGVIGGPQNAATLGPLAWATSGLTITLAVGNANVGGAGYSRSAPTTAVAVAPNTNSTLFRRDRIVLRRSTATHDVKPVVIQGTAAATPVAPDITRNSTTFDLPLFSFLVPTNSGTALSGVVDERVWLSESAPPVFLQADNVTTSIASGSNNRTGTTSFPTAFTAVPRSVQLTVEITDGQNVDAMVNLTDVTATGFSWRIRERGGNPVASTLAVALHWTAIL